MASKAQRRRQLELIKRAIIPQAVRPELRQVVVRDGAETVLIEGDVHSESWDRFPDDWPRGIQYVVVRPKDTEVGRKAETSTKV